MKTGLLVLLIWSLLMVQGDTQQPSSKPTPLPVGIVNKGDGEAFYGNKTRPLHKGDDVYKDWKITKVGTDGLALYFNDRSKQELITKDLPYTIPFKPVPQDALKSYFDRTGRQQGPSTSIYSPPITQGIVWPDRFVFRWVLSDNTRTVNLILRRFPMLTGGDMSLWAEGHLDGTKGEYISTKARNALNELRKREPNAQVELTLIGQDKERQKIVFGLLSVVEEMKLIAELEAADKEEGMLRFIERAHAFNRRRLFTEEAEVYENALNESPESIALRRATFYANRRTGNTVDEEYHRRKLLELEAIAPTD